MCIGSEAVLPLSDGCVGVRSKTLDTLDIALALCCSAHTQPIQAIQGGVRASARAISIRARVRRKDPMEELQCELVPAASGAPYAMCMRLTPDLLQQLTLANHAGTAATLQLGRGASDNVRHRPFPTLPRRWTVAERQGNDELLCRVCVAWGNGGRVQQALRRGMAPSLWPSPRKSCTRITSTRFVEDMLVHAGTLTTVCHHARRSPRPPKPATHRFVNPYPSPWARRSRLANRHAPHPTRRSRVSRAPTFSRAGGMSERGGRHRVPGPSA